LKGEDARGKNLKKSFFQSHVPHAGNWMNRTLNGPNAPNMMSNDQSSIDTHYTPTAGLRIPNTLKLSYPDKIPKIM